MQLDDFTLIKKIPRDPRPLVYLYPNTINTVLYAKQMQNYNNYQLLNLAEKIAKMYDAILVPSRLVHHRRAKKYKDYRVRIGNYAYYVIKKDWLTKNEINKLVEMIA